MSRNPSKKSSLRPPQPQSLSEYLEGTRPPASSGTTPFNQYVSALRMGEFDKSIGSLSYSKDVEDKKSIYIALATEVFGLDPAEAEREYDQKLSSVFSKQSQRNAAARQTPIGRPLKIPEGKVARYEGMRVSGSIDQFLRKAYPFYPEGEPLTLVYLRENDAKAYQALFNLKRKGPLASDLQIPTRNETSDALLTSHGLSLTSDAGRNEARRLMNVINARLYPR